MIHKCLFVGGNRDGMMITFPEESLRQFVAFDSNASSGMMICYDEDDLPEEKMTETYQCMSLGDKAFFDGDHDVYYIVFLLIGIPEENMGQLLINGYHKGKQAIKALAGDE